MQTVLFADDSPSIRDLFCGVLRDAGYSVLVAEDGSQALSLARLHPGAIDLLITDIVMPRMGGLELRHAVSECHPETAVLLISGNCAVTIHAEEPFLAKPFTPAVLLSTVKALFAARHMAAARTTQS